MITAEKAREIATEEFNTQNQKHLAEYMVEIERRIEEAARKGLFYIRIMTYPDRITYLIEDQLMVAGYKTTHLNATRDDNAMEEISWGLK